MTTPVASLVVYCYNVAPYAQAAVDSLLAQDYPNLEIVLSDDGSTDGTWEILETAAKAYRGPHRVQTYRNAHNCGIGSQINAAVALTTGELVLLANGDDVSEPDRASATVGAWQEAEPRPAALWSDLEQIAADGTPLGRRMDMRIAAGTLAAGVRARFSGANAASMALARDVFTRFGPLPDDLLLEDSPLALRASLIGPLRHIARPLVRYRVHDGNMSQAYAHAEFDAWRTRHHAKLLWHARQGAKAYAEMLRDLHQRPAASIDGRELAHARFAALEKGFENAMLADYRCGERAVSAGTRWRALARLAWLQFKLELKRLLPWIERRNERWHYAQIRGGQR